MGTCSYGYCRILARPQDIYNIFDSKNILSFMEQQETGSSTSFQQIKIGYTVEALGSISKTVEDLTLGLKNIGFGILSNIDVRRIIKEKIGEDIIDYVILDVCNPRHAKKALDAHKEVGMILPCKITVYEDRGKTWVSLYKPTEALKVLGFSDLDPLAQQVERELRGALDAIAR